MGGGAYLSNRDQIINVGMIRYSRSEDRTECPTYGASRIYGDDFQSGMGKCCERRRREPLGGSGGMPPRKFLNLKALKRHFQHSQAKGCVRKVPKIDRHFLNIDKNSVVISCNIFS